MSKFDFISMSIDLVKWRDPNKSIREIADELGISRFTLMRAMKGRGVDLNSVITMCNVMNIKIDKYVKNG